MSKTCRQNAIADIRKRYLLSDHLGSSLNEPFDSSGLRKEILDSWKISREHDVDPERTFLPSRYSREAISRFMSFYPPQDESAGVQWTAHAYPYLEKLGAVYLATNSDLIVLVRGGNKELINYLKIKNLNIGTNLSVERVGTNAAELASRLGKKTWVKGAEHYVEALQDLACFAAPIETQFGIVYIVLAARLKHLNAFHETFFEFLVEARQAAEDIQWGLRSGFDAAPLSAIEKQRQEQLQNHSAFSFDNLIGKNSAFEETKMLAKQAATSTSNVLITGESGTGKDLFAQAIHVESVRKNAPFIAVNCSAIPRDLISSELFGYVEGAFTGARKAGAAGKFEMANKGTLFLDEIGEMPVDMQAVLLRVLEDKKITRLGGNHATPVDVRVIAATNKDLRRRVKDGLFRLDLYYRLNVLSIEVCALRERLDDIPLLASYFVKQLGVSLNKNIQKISPQAIALLKHYHWPGNIRELRNVIERAMNLCVTAELKAEYIERALPKGSFDHRAKISFTKSGNSSSDSSGVIRLIGDYQEREKEMILALMKKYNGNKAKVSRDMGISRSTLYRKLERIGLERTGTLQ